MNQWNNGSDYLDFLIYHYSEQGKYYDMEEELELIDQEIINWLRFRQIIEFINHSLNERYSAMFMAYYFTSMTYREIGEYFGLPLSTARSEIKSVVELLMHKFNIQNKKEFIKKIRSKTNGKYINPHLSGSIQQLHCMDLPNLYRPEIENPL